MAIRNLDKDFLIPNNNNLFKSQLNKTLIYFYQITCKIPNIKDNYVGQTECFEKRKYEHCKDSATSGLKVYQIIRKYGGWENWNINVINCYYCKDEHEARQIEQKYIDFFKATMNSIRAYSKPNIDIELDRLLEFEIKNFSDKILGCYLYDYYFEIDNEQGMEECEFCKSLLKTKSNLTYHQKTNKKCLDIQKLLSVKINSELKNCNFCNKYFNTSNMKKHVLVCKIKKKFDYENIKNKITELENLNSKHLVKNRNLEKKNLQLKKQINDCENKINEITTDNNQLKTENNQLQTENNILKGQLMVLYKYHQTISNLAQQPKNTNNILYIQTPLDFNNIDNIKNIIITEYDDTYVFDGQKGVARFVVDHIVTDKNDNLTYVCTDPNKPIFEYKDLSGNIKKDIDAKKIINFLIEGGIQNKTIYILMKIMKNNKYKLNGKKYEEIIEQILDIKNLENNNTIFKKELVYMTTKN